MIGLVVGLLGRFGIGGRLASIGGEILVVLAILGAGLAAGEIWEHRGPQHFPLNLAGRSLALQRDQALEQLGGVRRDLEAANARARGWEASFRAAEQLRGREHGAAVTAAGDASRACETRIAEARRSAGAIVRLVSRPPATDANHCPARETIGGGELDEVFGRAGH